jgi:hypothetical protein
MSQIALADDLSGTQNQPNIKYFWLEMTIKPANLGRVPIVFCTQAGVVQFFPLVGLEMAIKPTGFGRVRVTAEFCTRQLRMRGQFFFPQTQPGYFLPIFTNPMSTHNPMGVAVKFYLHVWVRV